MDTVDEAIKHWTRMWEDDARYDSEVASNVQVTAHISLFVTNEFEARFFKFCLLKLMQICPNVFF